MEVIQHKYFNSSSMLNAFLLLIGEEKVVRSGIIPLGQDADGKTSYTFEVIYKANTEDIINDQNNSDNTGEEEQSIQEDTES